MDLFDRHLYEKGGVVLNMLRVHLGETMFWKAIRRYALSRRGSNVVTPDLQRAIEEAPAATSTGSSTSGSSARATRSSMAATPGTTPPRRPSSR